jgi:hypothetical protein
MRYELCVSAGDAGGSRHFCANEEYAVGDEITLGGEIWRIERIERQEGPDGTLTRLVSVPASAPR